MLELSSFTLKSPNNKLIRLFIKQDLYNSITARETVIETGISSIEKTNQCGSFSYSHNYVAKDDFFNWWSLEKNKSL